VHLIDVEKFGDVYQVWIYYIFWGLALVVKDIVFRFIIKCISPMDFGPWIIGLFLYEDFWKFIFWLVLKLEIIYRVMISWKILVSFTTFFWRLHFCMVKYLNSQKKICLKIFFNVNGKAIMWHTPCLIINCIFYYEFFSQKNYYIWN
jgi:hypothetical protein